MAAAPTASPTPITGRCYCGAVTFSFREGPIAARMCWCRDCQYLACGNASVNAIFRTETFEAAGERAAYESTADSGNHMRRTFCPTCGSQLFGESSARPDVMVVRVGALDDPTLATPQGVIWTASAPEWACWTKGLTETEGQPGPVGR